MAMRIVINLSEDSADVLSIYSAGAKVYLDSATTETGSYSNVTSTAVVSGTEQYELTDANGTSATWYKTRVGNSGGTAYSSYSAAFQATAWDAYATLDDLRRATPGVAGTTHDNVLSQVLLDAKAATDTDCARTFLRVPQVSGDVTVYCDVNHSGYSSLVSAIGIPYTVDGRALDIVSVTSLWYRDSETSSYVQIAAGDTGFYLEAGTGPGLAGSVWPYEDITLSPASATITVWPTGKRAVKIIGALGFPSIPDAVKRANIDHAREAFRQAIGTGPVQEGVNRFGVPVYATGKPESYRDLTRPTSVHVKRSHRTV